MPPVITWGEQDVDADLIDVLPIKVSEAFRILIGLPCSFLKLIAHPVGHRVIAVAWSPDGKHIALIGNDALCKYGMQPREQGFSRTVEVSLPYILQGWLGRLMDPYHTDQVYYARYKVPKKPLRIVRLSSIKTT